MCPTHVASSAEIASEETPVEASNDASNTATDASQSTQNVWLCLLCLRRGCSRSENGHALGHFERQRQHCVALSLLNFSCWCYCCDEEIAITAGHPLVDYMLALKRRFDPSYSASASKSEEDSSSDVASVAADAPEKPMKKKPNQCNKAAAVARKSFNVKGLANIGNTCFFNSTIQCLFHSSQIEVDLDRSLKATSFTIPRSKDSTMSPATVTLRPAEKCNMSLALRDLFNEMKDSMNPLIYPNNLFNQICAKVPRFRGYQQQDAHELLRHLLDTVKSEELLRIKSAITEKYCPNGSKSNEDNANLKRIMDLVGNSTVVDQLFGGQMVDTIVCMECHSINTVVQHFLDISLPLRKPNIDCDATDSQDNPSNAKAKRNKLRLEKKHRKPKEDKDGDWGNHDDEDEEVQRVLALSMESGIATV